MDGMKDSAQKQALSARAIEPGSSVASGTDYSPTVTLNRMKHIQGMDRLMDFKLTWAIKSILKY